MQTAEYPAAEWMPHSRAGGAYPRWRRDGREIFFVDRIGRMVAVEIEIAPSGPRIGKATPLFPHSRETLNGSEAAYDVSADGKTFLLSEERPVRLTVWVNRQERLKKRP